MHAETSPLTDGPGSGYAETPLTQAPVYTEAGGGNGGTGNTSSFYADVPLTQAPEYHTISCAGLVDYEVPVDYAAGTGALVDARVPPLGCACETASDACKRPATAVSLLAPHHLVCDHAHPAPTLPTPLLSWMLLFTAAATVAALFTLLRFISACRLARTETLTSPALEAAAAAREVMASAQCRLRGRVAPAASL